MKTVCPECASTRVTPSKLNGLSRCDGCGNVFVPEIQEAPIDPEVGFTIPDQIEVDIGWRAWGIDKDATTNPILKSINHPADWTPREPMQAVCSKEDHEVPTSSCSCGLYTARTLPHLLSLPNKYHRYDVESSGLFGVIGKVAVWGEVLECSQGWRSSLGYPSELYLPFEAYHLADGLKDAYGVPVYLKNFLREEK